MKLIPITLIVFLIPLVAIAEASLNHYALYTVTMEGTSIIVLNVFPSGQIVDPLVQYPLPRYQLDIAISSSTSYLVVGGGNITVFGIQENGNLSQISQSTKGADWVQITPNEEIVLTGTYTSNIFLLSTTGQLIPSGNSSFPPGSWAHINPRGNPVLTTGIGHNIEARQIDYVTKTVSTITAVQGGDGIWEGTWTPDGSLALILGPVPSPTNNDSIWVLGLDSTGSIFTTGQSLIPRFCPIHNIAFNRSGTIGLCSAEDSVITISIDTIRKIVHDNGIRTGPPVIGGSDMYKLRITPDDRLAIVAYADPTDNHIWLATAFLNGNGSLTWTGYRFPYDYYYTNPGDGLYDMEVISVYATDVPPELWKDLE
jgi:hypothetical protein